MVMLIYVHDLHSRVSIAFGQKSATSSQEYLQKVFQQYVYIYIIFSTPYSRYVLKERSAYLLKRLLRHISPVLSFVQRKRRKIETFSQYLKPV